MNCKIKESSLFVSNKYLVYTNPQGAAGKGLANFFFLEMGVWTRSSFAMAFWPISDVTRFILCKFVYEAPTYSKANTRILLCTPKGLLKLTTLFTSAEVEWIYVIKMIRGKKCELFALRF